MKNILTAIGIILLSLLTPLFIWGMLCFFAWSISPIVLKIIIGVYLSGMVASLLFSLLHNRKEISRHRYGIILMLYFMLWSWLDFLSKRTASAIE